MKSILLLFVCVLLGFSALAQTARGKVLDVSSEEPVVGATVVLTKDAQKYVTATGLDGEFSFNRLPSGTYVLKIRYIGYDEFVGEIATSDGKSSKVGMTVMLNSSKNILSQVTVSGQRNRESDEFARNKELTVSNIMNIVSSKSIESSPDITVGNVLQRVSGVSMIRSSSGDGQFAIIRGLATRYTYTSINGIIMPSPDAQTRSVPLDMFPADMIQRVEVTKALTPNIEANAIGGATNLVMKDAPPRLIISGNLSTGYSTIFADQKFSGFSGKDINFLSPTEQYGSNYVAKVSDFPVSQLNFNNVGLPLNLISGLSVGNRVFQNKIGFFVGGSYIREYRGGNTLLYQGQSVGTNPYSGPQAGIYPDTTKFTALQNREYSYLQSRLGLHAKIDFALSDDHSFKLYGLFLQLDDNQHRSTIQNGLSPGSEIDYYDRVQFTRKNIKNVSITGLDNILDNLKADWTLAYSEASSKTPDWVDLGRFKDSIESAPLYVSNPLTYQWLHSQDKDKSGYLNLKYTPLENLEINGGGSFRKKDRGSFYNHYSLSPILPGLSRQTFTDINSVKFSFNPASNAIGDTTDAQTYTATEDIYAAYLQAKITLQKLQVLAGVREESTHQSYYSNISPALPGKTGNYEYSDILPSVHLKYSLTKKENLRLSYFAGISRPNLYELVPTISSGDFYTQGGNNNLKHTTSQNVDFRYENFFSPTNYILAGVFYKRLTNPVESAFGSSATTLVSNSTVLQPTNPAGVVTDYGLELVFTKYFQKFGFSGNYTYIHSEVTTPKLISQRDATGSVVSIFPNQTRPMQGQADHIGNLSLLFKDPKTGFDVQLSLVYTGKRIAVVSPYYGLDLWQRANTQLDFSMNKSLSPHLVVFFKATNLLGSNAYQDILNVNTQKDRGYQEQADANRILVQRDVFKQTLLGGLRYRL